jgi:hypothetical protein
MNERLFNRSKCIRWPPNQDDSIADWKLPSEGLAAVRDFDPVEVSFGSFSTDPAAPASPVDVGCSANTRRQIQGAAPVG